MPLDRPDCDQGLLPEYTLIIMPPKSSTDALLLALYEMSFKQEARIIRLETAIPALIESLKKYLGAEYSEVYQREINKWDQNEEILQAKSRLEFLRERLQELKDEMEKPMKSNQLGVDNS